MPSPSSFSATSSRRSTARKIWCQLFSEPAAGSDVAGIRTRAERAKLSDGSDGWVINGQKVWTSARTYCDYGIIITRTDPNVPKHQGLTMFFLSMKTPGGGGAADQADVTAAPTSTRCSSPTCACPTRSVSAGRRRLESRPTTLMNERLAVGLPSGGLDVDELMELARDTELDDGPAIRNQQVRGKIADWYVQQQGLK